MNIYRISTCTYIGDKTGIGAKKYGGRWNSKGTAVLYTSDSRALCTAEIAVHTPLGIAPKNFCILEMTIPSSIAILEMDLNELPKNWNVFPHSKSTQKLGDTFVSENKYVAIKVPSSVVMGDFNYVLNPSHPDFSKIEFKEVKPFSFDQRLFIK